MKISIRNAFILSIAVLIISILLIFTFGYKVMFESSVQDIKKSMKSITLISASKVEDIFKNVANSTKTLADQYHNLYESKSSMPKAEQAKWMKKLQKTSKTGSFKLYPKEKDLKDPFASILFFNDFNFTEESMREFQAGLELREIMKNMHSTFNFSWVYFTTVNDMMIIYPYLPYKMSDDVYKPTQQHFYLAADFKNKTFGWEEPYLDLAGDGMMITVSYPLYKGDTLLGVASRDITLDQLSSSLLKNTLIYNGTIAFIVDKSGKAISNTDEQRQSEINEVNKKDYRAILYYRSIDELKKLNKEGIRSSSFSDMNEITDEVLKRYNPTEKAISFSLEGEQRYEIFAARVPVTGWYIISVIPNSSLFEASEKTFLYLAGFVIIAILFIYFLVGIGITRYIIAPIQVLNEGAKKISKGNLDVEVRVQSKNEIGNLSNTFNQMIRSIKKSQEELEDANQNLEKKVEVRTSELNEKNHELQYKNDTIMQSIEYAKTIQSSILPTKNGLNKYLSSHFVLWKPRDIVGGDLFWFHPIGASDYLIAAIDCTGHGVPGALMTMTANSLLDSIVAGKAKNDPGKILSILNMEIKATLRKDSNETKVDDGLDIGLCLVSPKKKILTFAGAKIPLYMIKDGELQTIEADKNSIGYNKTPEDAIYTNHVVPIKGDEYFYLASDGYQSQLGGEKDFPLGKKKFLEVILQNKNRSAEEQLSALEEAYEAYRKLNEQIDDILVIGFKVK
jgi:serine phosphatase RsbU (regulator of sigma subunit)